MFVGEKMRERREQERAEFSLLRIQPGEVVAREQARKKLLREILGIRIAIPFAPGKKINRRPVGAAKFFERGGVIRRTRLPGQQHDAPVRRVELRETVHGGILCHLTRKIVH